VLAEWALIIEQSLDRGVVTQANNIAQPVDVVAASVANKAIIVISVDVEARLVVVVVGAEDFAVVKRLADQRSEWNCPPGPLIRRLDCHRRL
jgi:hypothetical protein